MQIIVDVQLSRVIMLYIQLGRSDSKSSVYLKQAYTITI